MILLIVSFIALILFLCLVHAAYQIEQLKMQSLFADVIKCDAKYRFNTNICDLSTELERTLYLLLMTEKIKHTKTLKQGKLPGTPIPIATIGSRKLKLNAPH